MSSIFFFFSVKNIGGAVLLLIEINRRNSMPNVEVLCTVSNCAFHAKGNICGASQITVDMDYRSNYDTEFSQEFDIKSRKEEANHSGETSCRTFKPK